MSRPQHGKIITFYSYKGGTGRSMALANVAWILASNGKRVLTLDWDMEAPGLHRYFFPFLVDKDLTGSDGIIDFVIKYATAAATPRGDGAGANEEEGSIPPNTDVKWYEPYANILRYATSLDWKFEGGGSLDFIPSGRQGSSYATRVNSFNWKRFYEVLGGGTLLEIAKRKMREEYDYILVDSRTGVSDTSGICTVQMPDTLVICFTLNNQSILGASAVADDVYNQRSQLAHLFSAGSDGGGPRRSGEEAIEIFPVPTRVENAEKMKLQTRKEYAKEVFRLFPNTIPGEERELYWGNVPVLYVPYYAYEEILAPFGDNSADRISILAAAEQLTSYITGGEVSKLPPIRNEERDRILRQYETGVQEADPARRENALAESVFRRLTPDEQARSRRLLTRLVRVAGEGEAGGDTPLRVNASVLAADAAPLLRRLINLGFVEKGFDFRTESQTVSLKPATLIRNWERLGEWVDEDRDFLLWRQRLQTKIDEWEKSGRDAGALLSGTLLAEAKNWRETRGPELNAPEAEFIRASEEAEQRSERERRESEQDLARERAEAESRRRRFRRVAWGLPIAFVLCLLGIYTALNPYTERIVQDEPIFISHDRWVISRDRSVAVSFTKGRHSTIWRRGGKWNELPRIDVAFDTLAVSSRGTHLAGVTPDRKLHLWKSGDNLSGAAQPLLTFGPPTSDETRSFFFYQPVFSPDEKWVSILTSEGLYLLEVGKPPGDNPKPYFKPKAGKNVNRDFSVTFSPNGAYIALIDTDGELYVRRLADPSTPPPQATFSALSGRFNSPAVVSFSADEKFLATTGKNFTVHIADLGAFPALDFKSALTVESGGFSNESFKTYFSPGNQWVVSKQMFGDVYAWPMGQPPGNKVKPLIKHEGSSATEVRNPVGFSARGRWVSVIASDKSLYIWDVEQKGSADLAPIFKGDRDSGFSDRRSPGYAFNPAGTWVAANASDGSTYLWELGRLPDLTRPVAFLGGNTTSYDWSVDGRSIYIYGGADVFLVEPDKEPEQVPRQRSGIAALTLNTDDPNGGEELIIFDEHHLSRARRKAFFWNIEIRKFLWPQMSPRPASETENY